MFLSCSERWAKQEMIYVYVRNVFLETRKSTGTDENPSHLQHYNTALRIWDPISVQY